MSAIGRFLLFLAVFCGGATLAFGQMALQKLPADWQRPGFEAMHRPHPQTGTVYFLANGEASPSTISPYRCLPQAKPYELLQTVGGFVRRVTVAGTASWASAPAFAPHARTFAVSRWSDTCRSGKTPLELAFYTESPAGDLCLEGRCYALDTLLAWPAWSSVQFPFYQESKDRWVFSARQNTEDPLAVYAWSPENQGPSSPLPIDTSQRISKKSAPVLLVPATSGRDLIYPTFVGDTLFYSEVISAKDWKLHAVHHGQEHALPDWIPPHARLFNYQRWGKDSIAFNAAPLGGASGTDLYVFAPRRTRVLKSTYLPQFTAWFGDFSSTADALLAAEVLREKYTFNGLFINQVGRVFRLETPIEQNYQELEYQAAILGQSHPGAVLYENGYTEATEWVSIGFGTNKPSWTSASRDTLESFLRSHPAGSGHLEIHVYFPQNKAWEEGMALGIERAKNLRKWADKAGWTNAEVSVRSADPALEWCPTQDTCRGQLVGHWGRLVFVPRDFKRTELFRAREAMVRIAKKESASAVAWNLPQYALELGIFSGVEEAAQVGQALLVQQPDLHLELAQRLTKLWALELPVQGDEGNAQFFQKDWFDRGFSEVRWVDYGSVRGGRRMPETIQETAADSALWVGPSAASTSGIGRLRSAINRAQGSASVVRISNRDPLTGLCDVPGACADGWVTGKYTLLMPRLDPVRRSPALEQKTKETERQPYPLPGASPAWWIVLDSSDQPEAAYALSKSLAKKSRLTADLGVFLMGQKWRIGLFGTGDPATGDALHGILTEDFSGATFHADSRPFGGVMEMQNWTGTPLSVCSEVVAWRSAHPELPARVVLYGPKDRTSFSGATLAAFANQLNKELQAQNLAPLEVILEWNDPHASECSSGCSHRNPPHNRLVIFAAKP